MVHLLVNDKQVIYESVKDAMTSIGCEFTRNNLNAVLIWNDTMNSQIEYRKHKPWQVINRITNMNVICHKTPMAILLKEIEDKYPDLYNFTPKTFLLPEKEDEFIEYMNNNVNTYIIKPDTGSLGKGIKILENGGKYTTPQGNAVAQVYISSYLIDNRKFDFRIYALIASVDPLTIYVYRDGVARFCSVQSGNPSKFARLTNVSLNKTVSGVNISDISKLISDVLPILAANGCDINKLWKEIDRIIILTIVSSYGYLHRGQQQNCPNIGYPRCFQILGFDILIDKYFRPWLMEVNYRPSLEFYQGPEKRMKSQMVADSIRICCPLEHVQAFLNARGCAWTRTAWVGFLESNPEIFEEIKMRKRHAVEDSLFEQVWPSDDQSLQEVNNVIDTVLKTKSHDLPGFKPRMINSTSF